MAFSCPFGIVVPGVSSTIILMLFGIYPIYLEAVSNLYFSILVPIGIGLVLGGFCFMQLTKYLLEHFYGSTFYAILGFSIGSIFILLPNLSSTLEVLISILCTTLGFMIVFIFEKTAIVKSKETKK